MHKSDVHDMNDNVKKWVAALRSGKYAQDQGYLRTSLGYCCLGVACDVSGLGEWEDKTENAEGRAYVIEEDQDVGMELLPDAVKEWLGLSTKAGQFDYDMSLVSLNDSCVPFSEIANVIESYYDVLRNYNTDPRLFKIDA